MKSPRAVFFDYGGVLAEEGFALGLRAIADMNGLPGDDFVKKGYDLVHETGFVTGRVLEKEYWECVRAETGISGGDDALRQEILSHFTLRRWMIDLLGDLRDRIPLLGILSDQTNWLEELNERDRFFRHFDRVYNSFYLGKSKRDPALFDHVLRLLEIPGEDVLFVDDHARNCERATQAGMKTIHFTGRRPFLSELEKRVPSFK